MIPWSWSSEVLLHAPCPHHSSQLGRVSCCRHLPYEPISLARSHAANGEILSDRLTGYSALNSRWIHSKFISLQIILRIVLSISGSWKMLEVWQVCPLWQNRLSTLVPRKHRMKLRPLKLHNSNDNAFSILVGEPPWNLRVSAKKRAQDTKAIAAPWTVDRFPSVVYPDFYIFDLHL